MASSGTKIRAWEFHHMPECENQSIRLSRMQPRRQFFSKFSDIRRFFIVVYLSCTFAGPLLCALLRSSQVGVLQTRSTVSILHYEDLSSALCGQIDAILVDKPSYTHFRGFDAWTQFVGIVIQTAMEYLGLRQRMGEDTAILERQTNISNEKDQHRKIGKGEEHRLYGGRANGSNLYFPAVCTEPRSCQESTGSMGSSHKDQPGFVTTET